ncbi:hypothetical protein GC163_11655 [bacterium]|nr:hypothetical protein [bacterium]
MTHKELASQMISQLPDEVTLPEIIEELQVCLAVDEALADIDAGRVYRHEDVLAHFQAGTPLPEFSQPDAAAASE